MNSSTPAQQGLEAQVLACRTSPSRGGQCMPRLCCTAHGLGSGFSLSSRLVSTFPTLASPPSRRPSSCTILSLASVTVHIGCLVHGSGQEEPSLGIATPDPLEPIHSVCDMMSSADGMKVINLNMGRVGEQG